VHATTAPEQGGLLLARPRCAAILDPRYHQVRQRRLCCTRAAAYSLDACDQADTMFAPVTTR